MSQENVQVVEGFYQAMSRADIAGVMGALDPKIEWNEAEHFVYADHSPYVGADTVLNGLFMRLATEWEGFKAVPEKFIGSGDTVAVLGRYHGTYRATGKTVDAQLVHVFTVANGKIVRFQQYTDTAQFRDVVS
ncbi:MAG: nuclear transport factor 2 family protein [Acidobacteriota bacterium]